MSDEDREAKERKNMMKYGMLEDDVYPMLRETKLWVSEDAISQWAYYQCLKLKEDGKEFDLDLINMITTSKWAYMFCQHVEDLPDVRERIVDSEWALNYCTLIRSDREVLARITDPVDAQLYFEYKRDRLESRVKIFSSTSKRAQVDKEIGKKKSKLNSLKNVISKFKRRKEA